MMHDEKDSELWNESWQRRNVATLSVRNVAITYRSHEYQVAAVLVHVVLLQLFLLVPSFRNGLFFVSILRKKSLLWARTPAESHT